MQIDIIDGKIWIQHNSTEVEIARKLSEGSISNQDIVLGFRSPSVRALIGQASGAGIAPRSD